MIGWLAGLALAAPAPVALTADEVAALTRGEVVVRAPDDRGVLVGAVDVPGTTPDQIWTAVLDFDLRKREVSAIRAIDVYAPASDPAGLGARFELSILGSTVVYHLRYTIDRTEGWCSFALDPAKPNDVTFVEGSYRVEPVAGGHRLVYQSRTDAGRAVPTIVKRWIATSSMRDQLEAMRTRAKSTG